MVDIESYIAALKITWIRRMLTSNYPWTTLIEKEIGQGAFWWNRNAQSLLHFGRKIGNMFWKETFRAFARLTSTLLIENNELGRCHLWYSNETKFKSEEISQWKRNGLHNINDLLTESGGFLSYNALKESFGISATYLDYLGLIRSLPKTFTAEFRSKQPEPIIHPYVS